MRARFWTTSDISGKTFEPNSIGLNDTPETPDVQLHERYFNDCLYFCIRRRFCPGSQDSERRSEKLFLLVSNAGHFVRDEETDQQKPMRRRMVRDQCVTPATRTKRFYGRKGSRVVWPPLVRHPRNGRKRGRYSHDNAPTS